MSLSRIVFVLAAPLYADLTTGSDNHSQFHYYDEGPSSNNWDRISDHIDTEHDSVCPPTPEWGDNMASSFRERYEGVIFQAPDRFDFDTDDYTWNVAHTSDDVYTNDGEDFCDLAHKEDSDSHHVEEDIEMYRSFAVDIGDRISPAVINEQSIHAGKSQLPYYSERKEKWRSTVDRAWEENNLSTEMQPQELALAIAKIKIKLAKGEDSIVGMVASDKVRDNAKEDYFKRYRLFTLRYSKKLNHIRRILRRNHPEYTDRQVCCTLLKQIGTLKARTYDQWTGGRKTKLSNAECETRKRALEAGKKLQEIVSQSHGMEEVNINDLDMAQIEILSRDLSIYPDQETTSALIASKFALNRYLKEFAGKSDKDLEDLTILRMDHQIKLQEEARREQTIREGRKSRNRKKVHNTQS